MSVTDVQVGPAEPPLETDIAPRPKGRGRGRLVLSYLLTLFFLVNLNFFLPRLMPGDPLDVLAGGNARAEQSIEQSDRERLQEYYGLDKPLVEQYFDYLGGLARGDLGYSIAFNRPVSDMIGERIGWTLLLVGSAVSIAALAGFTGGILSGWRRGRGLDRGLLGVFVGLGNLPSYFVAGVVLIVFSAKLGIFPIAGAQTPFAGYTGLERVLDIAHHLVLPASVMAIEFAVLYYLVMRSSVVGELGADYLRLGRAKGLPERRLKYRYAGRNALLPAVTSVALDIGLAVGITVFIERVFQYPGLGQLIFVSIGFLDYPLMQGCFLVIGVMVLTANLVADFLYPLIDPRVNP